MFSSAGHRHVSDVSLQDRLNINNGISGLLVFKKVWLQVNEPNSKYIYYLT